MNGCFCFSLVHTAQERPRASQKLPGAWICLDRATGGQTTTNACSLTLSAVSLRLLPLSGATPDILPSLDGGGQKDTRNERRLLPLAGRQRVPSLCAASGVQSVIPPLCAPRPGVRGEALAPLGHPALGAWAPRGSQAGP